MHFNKIMFVKVKCESCWLRRYRLSLLKYKTDRCVVLYALQSGILVVERLQGTASLSQNDRCLIEKFSCTNQSVVAFVALDLLPSPIPT